MLINNFVTELRYQLVSEEKKTIKFYNRQKLHVEQVVGID